MDRKKGYILDGIQEQVDAMYIIVKWQICIFSLNINDSVYVVVVMF